VRGPTHTLGQRIRTCNDTRTGLDHVSFGVAQRADLDTWAKHFKMHSVLQSPIKDQERYAVLVFRDPDNIQLELISMG
jgi:glyoxylase I family protein